MVLRGSAGDCASRSAGRNVLVFRFKLVPDYGASAQGKASGGPRPRSGFFHAPDAADLAAVFCRSRHVRADGIDLERLTRSKQLLDSVPAAHWQLVQRTAWTDEFAVEPLWSINLEEQFYLLWPF